MGINVLSCFDGISCGQLALQRAGIQVDNYFASEIDKYAIKITQKNFPNTVQLGDIQNWKSWNLPKIDLLIGGSPCQGFSNAGLGLNFEDPRSKLFFTFCDILAVYYGKNRDMKYFLENVKMKKKWSAIITDYMKVEPVLINSALPSAQNRERLYWANWEFGQPEDKGIYLKDIIEEGLVDRDKSYSIDANYYKGGNPRLYFEDGRRRLVFEHQSHRRAMVKTNIAIGRQVGRGINSEGKRDDYNQDIKPEQRIEVTRKDGKSGTVSTVQKDNLLIQVGSLYKNNGDAGRIYSVEDKARTLKGEAGGGGAKMGLITEDGYTYRKLTPLECERLQTMPDNWTSGISNTQRYKCIGNGWTVDVVAHIFSHLKEFYTV